MTVEEDIRRVLSDLVEDRVYPDTTPTNPALPLIVYQQAGGTPLNFYSGAPDKRNGRFQVFVWAESREEASRIARQAEDRLRLAPELLADTLGGALSTYEPETDWYGSTQDFSIWFTS